jgi:sortase (surface protein transpeptidase)
MDDLEQLAAGDRVWMRTDRGRIGYDVRSVVVLGKGELAERAEQLFSQEVPGRLVLITCEDWNGVEYLSNVVVTATPAA